MTTVWIIPPPPAGHNKPSPAELASEVMERLGVFLKDHPVIETHEEAVAAAKLAELSRKHLDDLEDERKERGRPLRDQLASINAEYEPVKTAREVLEILSQRLTAFARAEEARRRAEADRLAREAEEAVRRVSEAIRARAEASDDASQGEVGVDLVSAVATEGTALRDAARIAREAARAERSIPVRLPTGFGRAKSLRSTEVLTVTDPVAAINEIGLTPDISEAILSGARAYRKLKNRLPAGIATATERSI